MKSPRFVRGSLVRAAFLVGCLCTHARAIETAGTLLIDLDCADYNVAEGIWPQHSLTGIQGSFSKQPTGTPQLETIAGRTALVLDGDGDFLTGPLTTSALHAAGAPYSVEYWAFQGQIRPEETVVSWSSRGGPDGTHAAFRYSSGNAGAVGRWGGPDMAYVAPHAGGPAVGQWHHIVATYDGTAEKVYVDGVLNAQENATLDAKDATPIYIGTERNNDATSTDSGRVRQFSGAISKIRIHGGALSATQVKANYDAELPQHPGITTTALLHPPVNRWSFSEAAAAAPEGTIVTDSMGGLNGVIRGTGATFTGTGLTLPGGAPAALPAYVDLPNGLISSKQRVSFELWVTQNSTAPVVQTGSRMVVFSKSTLGEINYAGNTPAFNGADSIALHAHQAGNNHMRLERVGGTIPNGGNGRQSENATTFGTKVHYVVVYDPQFKEWRSYRNGYLMEALPETQGPSTIGDVNCWLGRSDYGADNGFAGTFDEFRIYNYTLSEGEIRGNTVAGPDALTSAAVQPLAWTPTAGGTYAFNNAGGQENWGTGNPFPDAAGSFASIVTNLTGDQTVELNTTATVGSLAFGDADGSNKITIAAGTGGVLDLNGGAGMNASLSQTAASAPNEISAPLQFSSYTELANTSSTAALTLSGPLTGTAGLSKTGGPVLLTGNSNGAYTGPIAVQGGILSVGDGGTSGTLHGGTIDINDEGTLVFNRSDATTVNPTTTGTGTVRFAGSGTVTHTGNLGSAIVQVSGTGQVTNAGTINAPNSIVVDPVSSLLNHSPLTVGNFANINGEFVMDLPTSFNVGTDLNVGDRVMGPSALKISDGTVNAATIYVGKNVNTSGVILQTGGVVNDVTGGNDGQIGGTNNEAKASWGAYRMLGGVLNTTNHFQVGSHGIGVMEVENATVNFNGGFPSIGRFRNAAGDPYGRGVLDVRNGGVVNQLIAGNRINIGEKGIGTLNIRDGGLLNVAGGLAVGLGGATDAGEGTVNLLPGGTLLTQLVGQGNTITGGAGVARLNFHGGILRAKGNQPGTTTNDFISGLDRAYVYARGAIIDTNGFSVRATQMFEDPTGDGVATIPVLNGGSGYLAPPYLEIVGDGVGATAFANLTNGSITSITITNPGTDYTTPPTVNILGGGAGTGLQLGTPTMATNVPGSFTKTGSGTLSLQSFNPYTGPTNVAEGTLLINGDHGQATGKTTVVAGATLGGIGYLGSDVEVNGTLNPGTLTTGFTCGSLSMEKNVAFKEGSSLVIDIDDLQLPTCDNLAVQGNLDISHAALKVNVADIAKGLPYTIASFGSLTGTFVSVPPGTTVNYFTDRVVITAVGTPFQSWIGGYFPAGSDATIAGPDADPDGDGLSNAQEFALGGLPNNPADRAKVFALAADSSDTGTAKELVLTIAVLQGTPAFGGTPSPSASYNGYTYTVKGDTTLDAFDSAVSVVTPLTTDLPPAPAGYEYRSFRLDASDGLSSRGFLRVDVSATATP